MPAMASPASAPISAAAAATRERILDRAEALFAERGLAGTSVRDLAQAVGLTPASLYNHFSGKEALYEAVLERGVEPLLRLLQEHAPGGALDANDHVVDAVMEHLAAHPNLPCLIQHEAVCGGAYLTRLARGWIRPLLQQGMVALEHGPHAPFTRDEYPLVIAAWLHVIFGHFSMAPLLREVFQVDPLSPEGLAAQTRFLRKLARVMQETPEPTESPQSKEREP
ncbi:MAG: TetR/AcrR family transcriptional regulator [Proteobacteria bacterium]|nr:TetR/AcrR family transcriptional regulator [Pseudomonadota bacterium]